MNIPAYYDVDSAMKDYYSTLSHSSFECCESLLLPCTGVSSGYEDPSYLPQWPTGIDGYDPTYLSVNEESCGGFLAAEAAFATSHIPPVAVPIPAPPFHDYQASVPLLYSSEARSSLYEGQTIGGLQFGACIDSTMDNSAARTAFRQAPTPATAPCISPDLVSAGFDVAPVTDTYSPPATPGLPRVRGSRGRMRAASSSSSSSSPSAFSSSSSSSSPSPYPLPIPEPQPPAQSHLIACTRRNAPAHPTNTTSSPVILRTNRWTCPHCPYIQHNRRSPDLKRHIKTHTESADVAMWVCCGVYAPDAMNLGVPAEVIQQGQIIEFNGAPMIGGCRKTFSRRDALIRHLHKRKGRCFGDALSMWQPGNRLGQEEL